MPSGKTHDAITFILTIPVFIVAFALAGFLSAMVVTIGFLLGGLVFGPDLDTSSKQYHRWRVFKFLWIPYRTFFSHRSRWSHGLIFGTFIRVVYFAGVTTLFSFLIAFLLAIYLDGEMPNLNEFTEVWKQMGDFVKLHFGDYAIYFGFMGLWLGAASHTVVDIASTYLKTGRVKGLF